MQNRIDSKTKIRDKRYYEIITILQILMFEEHISKNTYDKVYGYLIEMEKNQPHKNDFMQDLLDECKKTQLLPPGNSSAQMMDAYVGSVTLTDGNKYDLSFTKRLF